MLISSARAVTCAQCPSPRGETSRRHVDSRGGHYARPGVPGDQQSWPSLGRRQVAQVLWDVVCAAAARAGIDKLAPHDLRRTCARLCHLAGGELDQSQFLVRHVSIQTTERYLGCKQKLRVAVNDRLGIESDAA